MELPYRLFSSRRAGAEAKRKLAIQLLLELQHFEVIICCHYFSKEVLNNEQPAHMGQF
jgi:hypothetical protein